MNVSYVPTTAESTPFIAAAIACHFDRIGYEEKEYFLSGTANLYEDAGHGKARVICENAPYTNRIIVRAPSDPATFSGNVVLEILNSTAGLDLDRMWVNSWKFLTRNGDIYVGITSKGHALDAMIAYDPERYAPINWANPLPNREPPEGMPTDGPFRYLPQYEMGLFWDMLTDCAKLLRSDSEHNPIRNYPNRHLYLTGWSQSTSYIARYLRTFYDEAHPLFEGYLSAGGGDVPMALNNCEKSLPPFYCDGLPRGSMMGCAQPLIALNTESENRVVNWVGDFDEPRFKFRTWQMPGTSHDSYYNLTGYFDLDGGRMMHKGGMHHEITFADGDFMDCPYEVIFNACFHHLFAWVRNGVPAPHAPKIETHIVFGASRDPLGSYMDNVVDLFGNARGGIRTPALDYPTATYTSFGTNADGTKNPMCGKINPFPSERLKALYQSLEHYRALVEQGADDMMAKGFLLKEDRDEYVERLVNDAAKRGLQ